MLETAPDGKSWQRRPPYISEKNGCLKKKNGCLTRKASKHAIPTIGKRKAQKLFCRGNDKRTSSRREAELVTLSRHKKLESPLLLREFQLPEIFTMSSFFR